MHHSRVLQSPRRDDICPEAPAPRPLSSSCSAASGCDLHSSPAALRSCDVICPCTRHSGGAGMGEQSSQKGRTGRPRSRCPWAAPSVSALQALALSSMSSSLLYGAVCVAEDSCSPLLPGQVWANGEPAFIRSSFLQFPEHSSLPLSLQWQSLLCACAFSCLLEAIEAFLSCSSRLLEPPAGFQSRSYTLGVSYSHTPLLCPEFCVHFAA